MNGNLLFFFERHFLKKKNRSNNHRVPHKLFCVEMTTQLAFTCSKLTTEALEQGAKYVQS